MSNLKRVLIIIGLLTTFSLLAVNTVSAQQQTHTVQPGDSLASIADFYDSSVEAIAAANGIINPNRITIGQSLVIPAPGSNVNNSVQSYTVQPGDRLIDIATRYNTTVEALQQTNGITNGNFITPGQVLMLPPTGGAVVAPNTRTTTTVTVQPTITRTTVNGRYMVQSGDTLFAIARSFNTDVYSIASENGLLNLNRIFVGQSLIIPGR